MTCEYKQDTHQSLLMFKPDAYRMSEDDERTMRQFIFGELNTVNSFTVVLTPTLLRELYPHHTGEYSWPRIENDMAGEKVEVFIVVKQKRRYWEQGVHDMSVYDVCRRTVSEMRYRFCKNPERPKHENLLHAPANEIEFHENAAVLMRHHCNQQRLELLGVLNT